MTNDPYNLTRFVEAQARDYAIALAEIHAGQKRSHWIWYIFPQLAGLGRSETARFYGIASLDEAKAYLAHPVLGPRLIECVEALAPLTATTIEPPFGQIDTLKLRSCLTLFIEAGGGDLFSETLQRLFDGQKDESTLNLLR